MDGTGDMKRQSSVNTLVAGGSVLVRQEIWGKSQTVIQEIT